MTNDHRTQHVSGTTESKSTEHYSSDSKVIGGKQAPNPMTETYDVALKKL